MHTRGLVESVHTQTEATFNSPVKLFLHSANTRAKHTVSVLTCCHNLSQPLPTAPSGEDCIYKNTQKKHWQCKQCMADTLAREPEE